MDNVGSSLGERNDHGCQYMSDAFQSELRFLGIDSSPAFVRAPKGNGCAEQVVDWARLVRVIPARVTSICRHGPEDSFSDIGLLEMSN